MAGVGASEHLVIFHQSIQSIFDGWTGLQLSVRQGCGGPHSVEKARWMVDAVHNWFTENDGIEPYELEDFLADILDHEFETIVEDDSLNVVSTNICTNFHLCKTGRHQAVLDKIEATPAARLGECVADETENMEEGDGGEGSVQDTNMQAMLGGMRLGHQSQDQQGTSSQQNNGEIPGTSSSSSLGATAGACSSGSSSNSRQAPSEDEDGWTVVGKSKKK